MTRLLLILLFPLCLIAQTRSVINTGSTANDGTGDSLRTFAIKSNSNFSNLWSAVYTNGVSPASYRFNTNHFTTSGTNVSLAPSLYLTNALAIEGGLTNDVEFNDVNTMTLDASTLNLYGVSAISLSSTGVGTNQGQVEIRADQLLTLLTPNQVAGTATVGQALKLVDATTGEVEFGDVASTGSLRYDTSQSLSTSEVNQTFQNLKQRHVAFLMKRGVITAAISTVARTTNVATVVTDVAHGMIVGQKVSVNATTDNTFDATDVAVISVVSTNSFTYASTGTDKGTTADTGTLTSWEVVTDATHSNWGSPFIQAISTNNITIGWDTPPVGSKVLFATIGNHQNSYSGRIIPTFNGVGLQTATLTMRHVETISGRVYWNGTTTGGGVTSNNNWVKEGDTSSCLFDAGQNAFFIAHSANRLTSGGSRGASSWPMPVLESDHPSVDVVLPNFQASPFTAAAYQPSETGFYCQLYDASGTLHTQSSLEAITPASRVQVNWTRTVNANVADHNAFPQTVTFWVHVCFLTP